VAESHNCNSIYQKGAITCQPVDYTAGAAIIGGTGDTSPQHFGWGDAKVNVPPLIAHLVKFLGHIFHSDKLDYCICGVTGVSMHCF